MSALNRFLLRVLLWLPVCFGAWYFLSVLFTVPLALTVDALMGWVFPDLLEHVTQKGNELTVITRAVVSVQAESGARTGDILLELNPLKYGYSMPLYTALVLAVSGEEWPKTRRWLSTTTEPESPCVPICGLWAVSARIPIWLVSVLTPMPGP